jgi:hypothetical protein
MTAIQVSVAGGFIMAAGVAGVHDAVAVLMTPPLSPTDREGVRR